MSPTHPLLFAIIVLVAGCGPSGPKLFPVEGTVTFDGKPVEQGYISFTADGAVAAPTSARIANGKYSASMPAGRKKVTVEAQRFVGPKNDKMGLQPREDYIPTKYNVETILSAEVKPDGKNQFDFNLKGDGS